MRVIFIDMYNIIKIYSVIKMFKWKIIKSYYMKKIVVGYRNSDGIE